MKRILPLASRLFVLLVFCGLTGLAQTGALHVLASNGMREVLKDVTPQCQRAIGHPLAFVFDSTTGLKAKIAAGETFDAVVLTSDAVEELASSGKVASASTTRIARCGIGIGIRKGAPRPDITTSAALKQALLKSRSITFAQDGASRVHILEMFDKFGIAEAMKPKIMPEHGSVRSAGLVRDGKSDMVLTLISEILPIEGVELLGPLPKDVQSYVNFSAGTAVHPQNPEAAKAMIRFLTGPAAAPVYEAKGMEAVAGGGK